MPDNTRGGAIPAHAAPGLDFGGVQTSPCLTLDPEKADPSCQAYKSSLGARLQSHRRGNDRDAVRGDSAHEYRSLRESSPTTLAMAKADARSTRFAVLEPPRAELQRASRRAKACSHG